MSGNGLELVIERMETVATGVVSLTLVRPDGGELPVWTAGAHIDLHFSSGGIDYVRQYSLCGPASDRHRWQIAVHRAPDSRGGSSHIHQRFAQGLGVRVTGPRNNFPLVGAQRYLFIAGGIGITPILAMIESLPSKGPDWRLLYCGRSLESMAFTERLRQLGTDNVTLHESDRNGVADIDSLIAASHPETAIFCCGPESLLNAVQDICARRSIGTVHFERFSRRSDVAENSATTFEVEFAKSGVVATVPPERSILEIAEEHGVEIESSCQEGVCGSCETSVISGRPDHRDSVLTAKERAEGHSIMVCVSRSCTARLVLDA